MLTLLRRYRFANALPGKNYFYTDSLGVRLHGREFYSRDFSR
ncbi:MAG: hypothetical protein AB1589_21815 [Cyanobacteriota bacterium]